MRSFVAPCAGFGQPDSKGKLSDLRANDGVRRARADILDGPAAVYDWRATGLEGRAALVSPRLLHRGDRRMFLCVCKLLPLTHSVSGRVSAAVGCFWAFGGAVPAECRVRPPTPSPHQGHLFCPLRGVLVSVPVGRSEAFAPLHTPPLRRVRSEPARSLLSPPPRSSCPRRRCRRRLRHPTRSSNCLCGGQPREGRRLLLRRFSRATGGRPLRCAAGHISVDAPFVCARAARGLGGGRRRCWKTAVRARVLLEDSFVRQSERARSGRPG